MIPPLRKFAVPLSGDVGIRLNAPHLGFIGPGHLRQPARQRTPEDLAVLLRLGCRPSRHRRT